MRALFAAMIFALLLSLAGVGCSGTRVEKSVIKMEEVPPDVMKVAKEKLPEVTFSEAFKKGANYEVRGKEKSGKIREIEITPDGKVIEIE